MIYSTVFTVFGCIEYEYVYVCIEYAVKTEQLQTWFEWPLWVWCKYIYLKSLGKNTWKTKAHNNDNLTVI